MPPDHPHPVATCRSRTTVHSPRGQVQQLKGLGLQEILPCSDLRLSDCRHLHCTGTAIRVSRICCGPGRCAQGSCTRSRGPRVCDQQELARPPGVCARTHAPTHWNACGRHTRTLRNCPALRLLPTALPSSSTTYENGASRQLLRQSCGG
jgi:hypothetical protein